jgi:cobalt-zinc-cadmium efflux system protein
VGKDSSHNHDHSNPAAAGAAGAGRALTVALALTAAFLLAEALAGWLTRSLALVADAGHMLTDVAALALSLFALRIAARPATHARTYGFKRVEVLAAAVNGIALVAIAIYIVWEAVGRLDAPAEVRGGPMLLVALGGLAVNLIAMRLLAGDHDGSLNLRSAYLHVLGDTLGSLGAIAAVLVILLTGWTRADPLISLLIAVLIVVSAWRLLRESIDVLLESTPVGIDVGRLEEAITAIPDVQCVHDVHVWTVTSGFFAMSAHISVLDAGDYNRVMVAAQSLLRERFGITHATLQMETPALEALLPESHLPGDQPCLHGHVRAEMAAHPH